MSFFFQSSRFTPRKSGCKDEFKLLPSLVFEIENFESATIKMEQSTGVKLYSEFRRSTARDFQIKLDQRVCDFPSFFI
jgi:hypothetical protein